MTDINLANIINNIDGQDKIPGLYVVATPIGNILDIGVRALFILEMCDVLYAEDTRVTRKLLSFYGISKKIISCNEHNAARLSSEIVSLLSSKELMVVIVTDAGTPLISDPGYRVVNACVENGIYVTSVPGPCSVINALVLSGLLDGSFYFHGFLPYKSVGRVNALNSVKHIKSLIVFLESPYRIRRSLEDMFCVFGNVKVALAREMTKKFEEVVRGQLEDVLTMNFAEKGEFVVVLNNV